MSSKMRLLTGVTVAAAILALALSAGAGWFDLPF
jgi:hypothetical protein